MEDEFEGVAEKVRNVILPSYVKTSSKQTMSATSYAKDEQIEQLLKDVMPKVLLKGDKNEVNALINSESPFPVVQRLNNTTIHRINH